MSLLIKAILGFFNNAIPIWAGYSIYNISGNNLLFAFAGTFITYTVTSGNPISYLLAFPIFEYFYSGSLTIYSYTYIGLVMLNIATVLGIAIFSPKQL